MKRNTTCILFLIFLTLFTNSCNNRSNGNKDVVQYKTRYQFVNGLHDTILAALNLDTTNTDVTVKSILLSNKQKLSFLDSLPRFLESYKLETSDLNFDGYQDIKSLRESGATGNVWYDTWLFMPSHNSWVYNHFLSSVPTVVIDSANRKVITYYQGGYTENQLKVYDVVKDTSFKLSGIMRSEFQNGEFLITLTDYNNKIVLFRDTFKFSKDLLRLYDSVTHSPKTKF